MEQLQYRNQQLEQQLRALQDGQSRPASRPPALPQRQSPPRPGAQIRRRLPWLRRRRSSLQRRRLRPSPEPPAPGRSGRGDAFDPALNPAAPGAPRPLGTSPAATEPPPPVASRSAGWAHPVAPARRAARSFDVSAPPNAAAPRCRRRRNCRRRRRAIRATGAVQATLPPGATPEGRIRSRLRLPAAQGLRAGGGRVPRISCANIRATASRPTRNTGSAKLVPAPALSRCRRSLPHRLDQVRNHRARRPMRCCGSGSRSRRSAKRKRPAPRSARCCANIRAPR